MEFALDLNDKNPMIKIQHDLSSVGLRLPYNIIFTKNEHEFVGTWL